MRGFAPGAPGHKAGVVDDENGVEGGQEGVGVFGAGCCCHGGGVGGEWAEGFCGGGGSVGGRGLVGGDGEGVETGADGAAGWGPGVEEFVALGGLEEGLSGELSRGDGGDG